MATLICNRIGFYSFLLCGVFLAWPNISHAAETRPLVYRVEQTRMLQDLVDKSEVLHKQNYETVATTPAGQQVTRYTTRSTLFSKARLGAMTRGALGGPLGIGITTALVAANFYLDEDSGEITKTTPADTMPSTTGTRCYVDQGTNKGYYYDIYAPACLTLIFPNGTTTSGGIQFEYDSYTRSCSSGNCQLTIKGRSINYSTTLIYILGNFLYPDTSDVPNPLPVTQPASDTDLSTTILNNPDLASDILSDSISSGRWPTEWPEAKDTADDISDTLGQDIEGTPAQDYDDTISDGSTVTQPPPETESDIEIEFPVFCDWASIVCDFITWMQGEPEYPEDISLPTAEIDLDDTNYDSGITVVTCPVPITVHINTFDLDLQIKWDYLCGLAEMIRPVVIAFSWLLGIYILIRVK